MSVVQPVPRSMTNEGVVDEEVQRQAVERLPGRPAPVHGHTGTPARRVCTLFAPSHEANADGKAVASSGVMWSVCYLCICLDQSRVCGPVTGSETMVL